jgi:thioester reductase-like protein
MASIFLTGFPGFLGSELVRRLLWRYPAEVSINCLIQSSYRPLAEQRAAGIEQENPDFAGRIHLYEGDITRADLGLGSHIQEIICDIVEIYHLAAVYDLGVKRELAMRVNVDGTRNVLDFGARCGQNLKRIHYVSTCYVSGRYAGVFAEKDLAKGQSFSNYYEETKYLAEIEVQRCREDGLPITIYRPAVVVGDSRTGATQKYDGIYYLLQLLLRQPSVALVPVIRDPARYEFNLVPRDYVVDAISFLSSQAVSLGKVYQLCDPEPLTIDQLIDACAQATSRRAVRVRLPQTLIKYSIKYVPGMHYLTKIEPETVPYFSLATHYTCENTLADLAGSGIACPSFNSYIDNLVSFMKQHPEISPNAMV